MSLFSGGAMWGACFISDEDRVHYPHYILYFSVLSFHGPTLSPRHTEEVWTEKDVVSMNLRF
jgi:hypothetical protein